jgi:hypothetical protein
MSLEQQASIFLHSPPTATDVERVSTLSHPILRNLWITQCYYELSTVFAGRSGLGANWCTYAAWASRQAGETIRKEDLQRTFAAVLHKEPEVEEALSVIATLATRLGAPQSFEQIKQSALANLIAAAVERSSVAVSRGNKKVFEEIGYEFARFIPTCASDNSYTESHIEEFCRTLRPGSPPDGQDYLRKAFTRYYQAFFENDVKKRTELQLLANLEIGFHEQTRLQPEIAESLNATLIDPDLIKSRLIDVLISKTSFWMQSRMFLQGLLGKKLLLDKAVDSLVLKVQERLRRLLTAHLMTLTLPPDNRLRLGQDLATKFPESLKDLTNPDLISLLSQIDSTLNSLRESGATDWANLPERMHFITDLFRCYHESKELFQRTFTPEQVDTMKKGKLPIGL